MDEILSIFKNYLIGSYKFNSNLFTEANNGISFTVNFVSNGKKFSGISISDSSIIYKGYKGSGSSNDDENTPTCRHTSGSTPTYSPYFGGNTSPHIGSSYSSNDDENTPTYRHTSGSTPTYSPYYGGNTSGSTPTYSPYFGGNTSPHICSSYSSNGDGNLDETTEDLIMDLYTFGEPYSIITFVEPVSQSSNKEFYDWFIVNTDPC